MPCRVSRLGEGRGEGEGGQVFWVPLERDGDALQEGFPPLDSTCYYHVLRTYELVARIHSPELHIIRRHVKEAPRLSMQPEGFSPRDKGN